MACIMCLIYFLLTLCQTVMPMILFEPTNSLKTDTVKVKVYSAIKDRKRREVTVPAMDKYYDVVMRIERETITRRLVRSDAVPQLFHRIESDEGWKEELDPSYKRDWATYTVNGANGFFILHRNNGTVQMEGYMQHGNILYLIQPSDQSKEHIAHTLGKSHENPYDDNGIGENSDWRRHRRAPERLVVEIVVVMDKPLIDYIARRLSGKTFNIKNRDKVREYLNRFYAMLITGMDRNMESLRRQNLNIHCRGKKLIFLYDHISTIKVLPHKKSPTQADRKTSCSIRTIERFTHWAKTKNLDKVDHSIYMTGYHTLTKSGILDLGLSYMKSICSDESQSMIMFHASMDPTLNSASHELGHSIGAVHDGEPGATECPAYEKYIMTTSATVKHIDRNWRIYSSCSYKAIDSYIKTLKDNCLLRTDSSLPKLHEFYGSVISPDEQCKMVVDKSSKFVGDANDMNNCQKLKCKLKKKKDGLEIREILAYQGTSCGTNKWCVNGVCVTRTN